MNGRHVAARSRVQHFVRLWNAAGWPDRVHSLNGQDLLITDLETLLTPRQVVRTLPELQALPAGTIIVTQGERAAQVEAYEDCDEEGELIVVKRLIYVGTDLDDYLTPERMHRDTLDTLRRMLPAIVLGTKDA